MHKEKLKNQRGEPVASAEAEELAGEIAERLNEAGLSGRARSLVGLRKLFDCGEVMQNAQKYINIAALIALAGWFALCFKMGWY